MKGRPFLVFFGYTHCPDICPMTLFEISEVMKSLGRDAARAPYSSPSIRNAIRRRRSRTTCRTSTRTCAGRPGPGSGRCGAQGLSGLCEENPTQGRRLHDGPHGGRLSYGQRRPLRRAIRFKADARSGGRPAARLPLKARAAGNGWEFLHSRSSFGGSVAWPAHSAKRVFAPPAVS